MDEIDLEIPTAAGFPLLVSRTYQSSVHVDGPIGSGWSSNLAARIHYAAYLFAAPSTYQYEAVLTMPDGARYRFVDSGDGTFTPPAGRYDVLVRNADGTYDLTLQRSSSVYHFGADGSLASIEDDYGNAIAFTYSGGELIRAEDLAGSGRYLDVYWGADGRISTIADHTGRFVEYEYNAAGLLISVTDPIGRTTSYEYEPYTTLLLEVKDHWNRVVTTVTYDGQDRVASYVDAGETYSYTYDYQNDPTRTAKSDSAGNTWVYVHGLGGLVTEEVPPAGSGGGVKYTEYNPDGTIDRVIDAVGVVTRHTYLADGRLASTTLDDQGPLAVRFEYSYDPNYPNSVSSIRSVSPATGENDPNWQGANYVYWQQGDPSPGALRAIYHLHDDGQTRQLHLSFTYDSQGRVLSATDGDGARADFEYNAAGDLVRALLPANNTDGHRPSYEHQFDNLGRLVSATDALGQVTTFNYDSVDRVIGTTSPKPAPGFPDEFTESTEYDQYDVLTDLVFAERSDINGRLVKLGQDAFGRLGQKIDEGGNITSFAFAQGMLASITDAHGHQTLYQYDSLRRLASTTFPDGAIESYTYTPDGLLETKTDREGQTITYTYDSLRRLASRIYPNLAAIDHVYEGQKLVGVVDTSVSPAENYSYTYDSLFRLKDEVQGARGTVSRSYTPGSRLQSLAVQGGPTTTYSYYPDGAVKSLEWSAVPGSFDYHYDLEGQTVQIVFPNGQTRAFAYDDRGRLVSLTNAHPAAGVLSEYSYTYDLNQSTGLNSELDQRTAMTQTAPAFGLLDAETKYYYDDRYQLTGAQYPGASPFNGELHEWTYDALGNRLTSSIDGSAVSYNYEQVGQPPTNWVRLSSAGVDNFDYDANGSLVEEDTPSGNTVFSWDWENRLSSVTGPNSTSFTYDHAGRRTGRAAGGITSSYLYADQSVVAESGTADRHYLFGPGLDELLAEESGGTTSYVSIDGLGSVTGTHHGGGSLASASLFDAWGVALSVTAGPQPRHGYTGREIEDGDTYFLRTRYYKASVGRFLSEDGLRELTPTVGGEIYGYVRNAPILHTDPFGLRRCKINVKKVYEGPWQTGWGQEVEFLFKRRIPWVKFTPKKGLPIPRTGVPWGEIEICYWAVYSVTTSVWREIWENTIVCKCPDAFHQDTNIIDGPEKRRVRRIGTEVTYGRLTPYRYTPCKAPD